MYSSLPKSTEAQVMGKQVLRPGTSVGANYREAYRARSKVEFIAKLGDCLKELDESSYWFELLNESGSIPSADLEPLQKECNELRQVLLSAFYSHGVPPSANEKLLIGLVSLLELNGRLPRHRSGRLFCGNNGGVLRRDYMISDGESRRQFLL